MIPENLMELVTTFGIPGLFIISFISNAFPYSTIPYLLWLIPYFVVVNDPARVALSILAASAGATAGKIVVYFIGKYFGELFKARATTRRISELVSRHEGSIFVLVLLVAATPMPDDIFYIPVGYAGYRLAYFVVALFIGKTVIMLLAAIYGKALSFLFVEALNAPLWASLPFSIILTLLIIRIVGIIRWEEIGREYISSGKKKAIIKFVEEAIRAVIEALTSPFIAIAKRVRGRREPRGEESSNPP